MMWEWVLLARRWRMSSRKGQALLPLPGTASALASPSEGRCVVLEQQTAAGALGFPHMTCQAQLVLSTGGSCSSRCTTTLSAWLLCRLRKEGTPAAMNAEQALRLGLTPGSSTYSG